MDYSAANAGLWNVIIQLGIIAGAVMLSNLLRRKISFIHRGLIPVSVIAGFMLLILKVAGVYPADAEFLELLVYHCIALGFIAMSLRTVNRKGASAARFTGLKSGAAIVGTYLVQALAGLVITLVLAYTFMPGLFRAAGLLLPMGYGQGPGQANNIGSTYEALGFAGGRSFGLSIAAAGYLCACTVGVVMLNVWSHKGLLKAGRKKDEADLLSADYFQDSNEIPVSDSIDRLSVQIAMVLLVYLATYLLTWGITSGLSAVSEGLGNTLNPLLWGFNFIIGSMMALLTRVVLDKAREMKIVVRQYQNNYLLNRISGFFFDLMIVAGIASINPEDISGLWIPFVLMASAGGTVTWLYLKKICRRIYGDYYHEGLISMYGMLTGTIGSGMLLLREIDPELETPAADNLVVGSSYGIVFGAPMLVLVSLATRSDLMCFVTFGLAAAYLALLTLLIYRLKRKKQ